MDMIVFVCFACFLAFYLIHSLLSFQVCGSGCIPSNPFQSVFYWCHAPHVDWSRDDSQSRVGLEI